MLNLLLVLCQGTRQITARATIFFFFKKRQTERGNAAKEIHLYKCKQYLNNTNLGKAFASRDYGVIT